LADNKIERREYLFCESLEDYGMIITRTPFRITLGGGGTDLPSYYEKRGGFLVTSAIDKYMYVAVNTPFVDRLIRVKYSRSETVSSISDLKHELVREALKHYGIRDSLEVVSFADISAGTGMGSSSCYLVGLLNALQVYRRKPGNVRSLAETACCIEIERLKRPIGKQDAYIASYGGMIIMEISKSGKVRVKPAAIRRTTVRDLERNLLLYYTGIQRRSETILKDQHQAMRARSHRRSRKVEASLDKIKELGYRSLEALQTNRLREFARIMDEHWEYKKQLSPKITSPGIDRAYAAAKRAGVWGGKLLGAGGGGFLLLYAEEGHRKIQELLYKKFGMKRLEFRFDFEGSKVLLDLVDSRMND